VLIRLIDRADDVGEHALAEVGVDVVAAVVEELAEDDAVVALVVVKVVDEQTAGAGRRIAAAVDDRHERARGRVGGRGDVGLRGRPVAVAIAHDLAPDRPFRLGLGEHVVHVLVVLDLDLLVLALLGLDRRRCRRARRSDIDGVPAQLELPLVVRPPIRIRVVVGRRYVVVLGIARRRRDGRRIGRVFDEIERAVVRCRRSRSRVCAVSSVAVCTRTVAAVRSRRTDGRLELQSRGRRVERRQTAVGGQRRLRAGRRCVWLGRGGVLGEDGLPLSSARGEHGLRIWLFWRAERERQVKLRFGLGRRLRRGGLGRRLPRLGRC